MDDIKLELTRKDAETLRMQMDHLVMHAYQPDPKDTDERAHSRRVMRLFCMRVGFKLEKALGK